MRAYSLATHLVKSLVPPLHFRSAEAYPKSLHRSQVLWVKKLLRTCAENASSEL